MAPGVGVWSNHIVPHLSAAGALYGPMAAGKKTLLRLRWLFLVQQLGGTWSLRHCLKLGNATLMEEDLFGESESDECEESD
mgnify:CR=1 FL=1